jgi:putative transposase
LLRPNRGWPPFPRNTILPPVTSGRRTGQLHRHRISMPGTIYFVPCCTSPRMPGLTRESVAIRIVAEVIACDRAQGTATFGFTIMPDRCHWVLRLVHRLGLGGIVARLKARTGSILLKAGLEWQRDFYEHRLASDEDPEAAALYTFLNPYRAGLARSHEVWPWWWSGMPDRLRFPGLLNPGGSPPFEWLGEPVPPWVCHGE